MDHPYCYPGTDVLRNKEDIRDGEELERFERVASARRLETLPHDLAITVDGFREIHRYMLQDVYDWAGEYRGVDTGRTGPFCLARFISHNMDARFAAINAENNLRGLAQREFAERAAEHMCELNAIHCFLDGNGRALRAFLQLLAAQAGHEIDLARIEPTAWNAAAIAGYHLPAHSWSAGETREFVAEGTVATSMIPAKLVASSRSSKGRKTMRAFAIASYAVLALAACGPALAQNPAPKAQAGKLNMYWIDTEGGAATLIVSPSGESLLIDTGFPTDDRDAKRIFAAAQQAGLDHIDHLVISHWHADHEGGLAAFAKMMPISKLYDHGDTVSPEDAGRLADYKTVAGTKRVIVKPGDKIPVKGLDVLVVTSDQKQIESPVNGGGPNPLCANAPRMEAAAPENLRTVGVLLSYNKFTYLNLIDLDWFKDMELACPANKVGKVTLYQTSRHGGLDDAGSPAFLGAIAPQVIVVNNGPRKGLGQTDQRAKAVADPQAVPYEHNSYLRMAKLPGLEGIWQQHLSLVDKNPMHNTAENMIANFEETADCKGNWIGASIAPDGKFTVTNGRNGFSKDYAAR